MKNQWSDQDKQNFKDRNVLKASTVPGKRQEGPSIEDWSVPPGEESYFQHLVETGAIAKAEEIFDAIDDETIQMEKGLTVDEVLTRINDIRLERTDIAQQDFDRRVR